MLVLAGEGADEFCPAGEGEAAAGVPLARDPFGK